MTSRHVDSRKRPRRSAWLPIQGLLLRQLYLLRGSPARILPTVAWVAIDIVLWGFIARYLDQVSGASVNFTGQLLGAVLFWDFFSRIMQGVTTAFFEDVWSRNFLNVFAAPVSIAQYVSALVITSLLTSSLGLFVMLGLSQVFGLTQLTSWPLTLTFVLILFAFGTALGIAACALVLRLGPASEWLIWPIPALLSPFAGVFYPLSTLPTWMRAIGRLLPPAYVFEALRGLLAGRELDYASIGLAGLLACAHVLVAAWLFVRTYRYAVRHGLLARYSAEGIG